MLIRSATNADAPAVRKVLFTVLEEYGLLAEHEGVDADLADIEGNYLRRGGLFDVVVAPECADASRNVGERGLQPIQGIVGMVGLFPRDNGVAELRKMYLLKPARGRGIGKTLLSRVLGRAGELGFQRIELETSTKLVEAIALYKSFGFQPLGLDQMSCRCDGAFYLDLPRAEAPR